MQTGFAVARALVFALLVFILAPAAPVQARDDLDISVFYEELEPYGRWFHHARYGYVWAPDVDDDWRPYSRGHWIFTDDHGWYWEAEEPWGWGPFHYGRWILDDEYGWLWIPGTEWGPAWVAWRYSDEYVGWAPLPPEAEWYEDRGLTFSASYYDGPRFAPIWIFVEPRYLVVPGLYRYALPRSRNHFALARTRWHTDYRFVNRRIYNAGFDVRRLERITRRPVVRVRIEASDSPRARGFRDRDRRVLHTYRPRLVAGPNPPRPPRLTDPPRREFRRHDGGNGGQVVRPRFTPQEQGGQTRERAIAAPPGDGDSRDDDRRRRARSRDDDARREQLVRPPREDQLRRRPPSEASGGPTPDFKKQEFKQPETDGRRFRQRDDRPPQAVIKPAEPSVGGERFRQRENRQPQAVQQPQARQRVEGGAAGGQPQGGPPPSRRDGNQGDNNKKGKQQEQKDGIIAR